MCHVIKYKLKEVLSYNEYNHGVIIVLNGMKNLEIVNHCKLNGVLFKFFLRFLHFPHKIENVNHDKLRM